MDELKEAVPTLLATMIMFVVRCYSMVAGLYAICSILLIPVMSGLAERLCGMAPPNATPESMGCYLTLSGVLQFVLPFFVALSAIFAGVLMLLFRGILAIGYHRRIPRIDILFSLAGSLLGTLYIFLYILAVFAFTSD